MARNENERFQREIDNLLRELRHSNACLDESRQRLEKLMKLSQCAPRDAKPKCKRFDRL